MSRTPAYRRPHARRPSISCGVRWSPWRVSPANLPPSTHMAISMSSRRTSTCLPTLILIFPARVHSSSSPVKSSIEPAFSDDHMLIAEYGSEYTSTFLPPQPLCVTNNQALRSKNRRITEGCVCGDWLLASDHQVKDILWDLDLLLEMPGCYRC